MIDLKDEAVCTLPKDLPAMKFLGPEVTDSDREYLIGTAEKLGVYRERIKLFMQGLESVLRMLDPNTEAIFVPSIRIKSKSGVEFSARIKWDHDEPECFLRLLVYNDSHYHSFDGMPDALVMPVYNAFPELLRLVASEFSATDFRQKLDEYYNYASEK